MKPTKLVISAFGPFKNEVTIDFEKLGGQGLFLVSGDTGSGKTTIFDAISFALFGSPSGERRNEENNMALRSQYAEKGVKTFVELTFIHKGKKYFIRRNPQYKRPSLRGNGETMESQGAELTFPEGRKVVDFRKVTNAVEDLLGINWAQYKQIAMIAQGEFLELLVADSDKRSAILRKIFGTGIYVNIQERLGVSTNRLRGECEEITNRIFQYFHDVQCPKDNRFYETIHQLLQNKSIHDTEKLISLISEMVRENKEQHISLTAQYKELEGKLTECRKKIAQLEQVNGMFATLERAKEEEQKLMNQASEMDEKAKALQQGMVALQYVKPLEEIYRNLVIEEESFKRKIAELRQEEGSLKSLLAVLLVEKENREKNQPRIQELAGLMVKRREEIVRYDQITDIEKERGRIQEAILSLQQELDRDRKQKVNMEQDRNFGKEKLEELKGIEVRKATIEATLDQLCHKKQTVDDLSQQFLQIVKEQQELSQAKEILLQKINFYNEENTNYNEVEQLYMKEQAGIMAADLKEGMPCPVCGSTHHPVKAPLTSGALTKEELKDLKTRLTKAHEAMQKESEICSSKTNTLEYKKELFVKAATEFIEFKEIIFEQPYKDVLDKVKNQIEKELATLKNSYKDATEGIKRKAQLEGQQLELEEKIGTLQAKLEDKEKQNSSLQQQLSGIEASLVFIKKEVSFSSLKELQSTIAQEEKEYTDLKEGLEETIRKFQEVSEKAQRTEAVLHDNLEQQIKLELKRKTAGQAYERALQDRGFGSEEIYKAALLSEKTIQLMQEEITAYRDSMTKVKQSITELSKALEGKERRSITLHREEEERISKEKDGLAERMESIRFTTNQNVDILKKVASAYSQHKDKTDEFAVYERLSKTANGNLSGKAKIAFEQYVQAFYFDQILAAANDRLRRMTDGQYELQRKDEATNLRKNTGLDIEVMDHYSGKPRSVKTLSGGESFKAALSLALGLSDIIQSFAGGIEVDAMFVDEGFGSLDSNSLEQALSALNALTIGNRLVGIISHVAELKERIDKKILLEKKRDGSILKLDIS